MNTVITVNALFMKQCKDILKNKQVLILFFVYPIIAYIMTKALPSEMGQTNFFISIFCTMHVVFTPIVATASVISEEKEKNTLRVLIMSNVKPSEYLFSIGGFVLICTLLTGIPFVFIGGYSGIVAVRFIIFMSIGCICSIILGGLIGTTSKNMMAASATAVPIGLLFAFLPMLSYFNQSIERISRYIYGQQISNLISNPAHIEDAYQSYIVIGMNMIIFLGLFMILYKNNKVEL